jgi:pimeloyl-ACP methyl ester carboxylesterase
MTNHLIRFALLLLFTYSAPVSSQDEFLKTIMQGYDFIGHPPENASWSVQGDSLYYFKKDSTSGLNVLYGYSVGQKTTERMDTTAQIHRLLVAPHAQWQIPGSRTRLAVVQGNLVRIPEQGAPELLLDLPSAVDIMAIGRDTFSVYLAMNQEFYRYNTLSGSLTRLNEILKQKPAEIIKDKSWLAQQEIALFEAHRENQKTKSIRDSLEKRHKGLFYLPAYFPDKNELRPLGICSDGRFVCYSQSLRSEQKYTQVPDYMGKDGFTGSLTARAKVGQEPPSHQLLIGDLQKDTFFTLDLGKLPGIYSKPLFLKEYAADSTTYTDKYEQPKPVFISKAIPNHELNLWLIEIFSQDNKDRWLILMDPSTTEWKLVDHQHDEAWIGGPGIRYSNSALGFIPSTQWLYFKSEISGYAHIHLYHCTSGTTKQLTSGKFEVHDMYWSSARDGFILKANKTDPGEYGLYLVNLSGEWQALTQMKGGHDFITDWEGRQIATLHSRSNRPPEWWIPAEGNEFWEPITRSTTPEFEAYDWKEPQFVGIPASDGAVVPARLYLPDDSVKNGAAVLFVHGAGYLQNAHKYWSTYYREYMFHHLLNEMGYTVLDVDFRASAGYGRDWRTAIYRHMGGRDLEDYIDARQYLIDRHGILPDKIGIYGGSYGGFITLMALFKHPGKFACGAALRSVTDWAHYNHGYTSNILNTPAQDSMAYLRSSPIYFAEGLQDPLLILHGVVDVNVQFQDVVRLNQKLIELEKKNYQMAIFPVEDHGFTRSSSWLDEYRRILELFEKHLR